MPTGQEQTIYGFHLFQDDVTHVASIATPTPRGLTASWIASAICLVNRSCTCSLLEYMSAIRASLLNPSTWIPPGETSTYEKRALRRTYRNGANGPVLFFRHFSSGGYRRIHGAKNPQLSGTSTWDEPQVPSVLSGGLWLH